LFASYEGESLAEEREDALIRNSEKRRGCSRDEKVSQPKKEKEGAASCGVWMREKRGKEGGIFLISGLRTAD